MKKIVLLFAFCIIVSFSNTVWGEIIQAGAAVDLFTLMGMADGSEDLLVTDATPGVTINDTDGDFEQYGYLEKWITNDYLTGNDGCRTFDRYTDNLPEDRVIYVIALKERSRIGQIGIAAESLIANIELYVIDGLGGASINDYALDLAQDGIAPNATLVDTGFSTAGAGAKRSFISGLIGAGAGVDGTHVALVNYGSTATKPSVSGYTIVAVPFTSVAINPDPCDGCTDVAVDPTLSWDPGLDPNNPSNPNPKIVSHIVHFKDDANDPNDLWSVEITNDGNRASYPVPGSLNTDSEYYWRVDEKLDDDSIIEGLPWTFSTVLALTYITENPVSQTVAPGTDVELTVAGENIIECQWYKDDVALTDVAGEISGATTATLTIIDAQIDDEGYYYCEADNGYDEPEGDIFATSATVRVMTERMVARWALDGDLTAIESNAAEDWDGVYVDPAGGEPNTIPAVEYVTGADGVADHAVKFNGYHLVGIPDSAAFFHFYPQGFTLTAWLKGPSGGDNVRPVNKDRFGFWQMADGSIGTYIWGTGGWITVVPSAEGAEDKWRFVAVTYDPAATDSERVSYGIYDEDDVLDVLHSTTTSGAAGGSVNVDLSIGGRDLVSTNPAYNYEGSVDDVRIYNYALTREELAAVQQEMVSTQLCLDSTDPTLAPYDFNNDCKVTMEDFAEFAGSWLNSNLLHP